MTTPLLLAVRHLRACSGEVFAAPALICSFATQTAKDVVVPAKKDWTALQVPKSTVASIPVAQGGAAFPGDLRGTSGLGLGDGLFDHNSKWLQGNQKSPMEYIAEAEPIKVEGLVVASHGSDDPALGCPVEYICLKGTTKEHPAVCKYTGNRYYSDTWKHGAHHH